MKLPLKTTVLIAGLSLAFGYWMATGATSLDSSLTKLGALPAKDEVTALVSTSSSNEQNLESGLLDALRLNKKTMERLGDSGRAIQAYMRDNFVSKRPNVRADYTDYYLVKAPAKFMGHDLIVIEEEYLSNYVGCCVSPGAGVTVKVADSTKNLEKFANENGCTLADNVDLQGELEHGFGTIVLRVRQRLSSAPTPTSPPAQAMGQSVALPQHTALGPSIDLPALSDYLAAFRFVLTKAGPCETRLCNHSSAR